MLKLWQREYAVRIFHVYIRPVHIVCRLFRDMNLPDALLLWIMAVILIIVILREMMARGLIKE